MKPYVYIIQNLEHTHWYVGMRSANECSANADTGYWGSSKYLDELIAQTGKDQWKKTIVAEFDTVAEASEHETELLELMWDWDGRVNKSRGGYIDYSDPEVRAKNKAAAQKRSENPEWIAKNKEKNQKLSQDPVWIENQKAGVQKNAQNPEWIEKMKIAAQKRSENPVWIAKMKAINQAKAQDPEWRAKQKAGAQKAFAKPFIATRIVTGEEFYCDSSYCDQAKALKLHPSHVSRCLNGKDAKYKGFTFRYV